MKEREAERVCYEEKEGEQRRAEEHLCGSGSGEHVVHRKKFGCVSATFAVPEALCLCWAWACTLSNVLIGHQKLDTLWETFCLHRNIVLLGLFKHGGDLLSVPIENSVFKLYFQHYSTKQQFNIWGLYCLMPPKIYLVVLYAYGRVHCRNIHVVLNVFD